MNVEDEGRFQRDAALLVQAKGIMANKSFFLLFFICALVTVVGLLVVGISMLPGWIMLGVLGALGAVGVWSGKGDEIMTLGVAGIAGVTGILASIVVTYVVLGIH